MKHRANLRLARQRRRLREELIDMDIDYSPPPEFYDDLDDKELDAVLAAMVLRAAKTDEDTRH